MNSKPHRQNSKFQLRYFLAADCKTPDGAWSLMYGQKIDMELKLAHAESQRLRREAKILAAQEILEDCLSKPSAKMEARADIVEAQADIPTWEMNLKAAKMEFQDIVDIMDELEPLRKYGHLDILEATEACQREEWLLELQTRAENYLMTGGTIPSDHFNTMRCHPDFKTELVPFITQTLSRINDAAQLNQPGLALSQVTDQPLALK